MAGSSDLLSCALEVYAMAGAPIPAFLYGTAWKEERTHGLTTLALEAGFVGIDTANQRKHYFEAAVGRAVRAFLASRRAERSTLFLQSKFTFRGGQDDRLPYDPRAPIGTQVEQSFAGSLEHFETDYLDSYILHGPSSRQGMQADDVEAWRAIEALALAGRARFIGVSNVSAEQLAELLAFAEVKPRFVQNRCYASAGWDREVRALCSEHDIVYQGFSLLTANRRELDTSSVREMAQRHQCSVAELVFAFTRQLGLLPLTGTSNPEHMRLDLGSSTLELEHAEVQALERLAR
jgi:diketogulonate reductase-like aldo/keto reductase